METKCLLLPLLWWCSAAKKSFPSLFFYQTFFPIYSPCSFSFPASPPGSSHAPLLLPSLGFWKLWVLPLWIKKSYSVQSTKAPCTAALQYAPWSPASPSDVTTTTLALHCRWTSMTCSTSETLPTFSRGSARHRKSGNVFFSVTAMVTSTLHIIK